VSKKAGCVRDLYRLERVCQREIAKSGKGEKNDEELGKNMGVRAAAKDNSGLGDRERVRSPRSDLASGRDKDGFVIKHRKSEFHVVDYTRGVKCIRMDGGKKKV